MSINRSFSQLSVSQGDSKKKKVTASNNDESNHDILETVNDDAAAEETEIEENDTSSPNNCIQRFKPKYLRVSDHIFKQMLSDACKDVDPIIGVIDTNEKLQFVRQMTEVTNNLHYIGLQRQLRQDYFNLGQKQGQ
ncbi:hypothetical protein NGRA_3545, partial [Nosema granulosis]